MQKRALVAAQDARRRSISSVAGVVGMEARAHLAATSSAAAAAAAAAALPPAHPRSLPHARPQQSVRRRCAAPLARHLSGKRFHGVTVGAAAGHDHDGGDPTRGGMSVGRSSSPASLTREYDQFAYDNWCVDNGVTAQCLYIGYPEGGPPDEAETHRGCIVSAPVAAGEGGHERRRRRRPTSRTETERTLCPFRFVEFVPRWTMRSDATTDAESDAPGVIGTFKRFVRTFERDPYPPATCSCGARRSSRWGFRRIPPTPSRRTSPTSCGSIRRTFLKGGFDRSFEWRWAGPHSPPPRAFDANQPTDRHAPYVLQ